MPLTTLCPRENTADTESGTGKKDNEYPKFEDPWTPENGALTASNKLQRRVIKDAYGDKTGKFEGLKAKGIR